MLSQNHRTVWFGVILKKFIQYQPLWHGLGQLSLDQVAQNSSKLASDTSMDHPQFSGKPWCCDKCHKRFQLPTAIINHDKFKHFIISIWFLLKEISAATSHYYSQNHRMALPLSCHWTPLQKPDLVFFAPSLHPSVMRTQLCPVLTARKQH